MSVAPNRVVFTTGGTVQAGGGTYLPRRADADLLALCRQSQFAYVLTARQMGKSSLMVRTVERLSEENIRAVMIDLTQIGTQVTPEQWYLGLLAIIEEQLQLNADAVAWWQANAHLGFTQRLTNFFQDVLLKEIAAPVVIFVDEIDTTLSLNFTDDFYAVIRYLYNARATTPAFKRLSFVLIGVATPGDLIRDPQRTPFNIGQRVDLTDFTPDEALPLATGLSLPPDEAAPVLDWVMKWTNGHPYLTQRLCLALVDQRRPHWTEADVDRVVANTFFGAMSEQDNNLQFVRDMLTKRAPDVEGVLTTYREVRSGKRPVRDEEQSLIKSHLKLSGVVKREGVELLVRNRIYETVFDEQWVREHLPTTWRKRFKYAAVALLAAFLISFPAISVYAVKNNQLAAKNKELEKALAETRRARDEAVKARENETVQRKVAESNAAETKRQSELAEASATNAEHQQRVAEANAAETERQRSLAQSRELAATALLQTNIDPDLSLSLAQEALQVAHTSQAADALRQILLEQPMQTVLRGHKGPLISAAYSPDGKFIVTTGTDDLAIIWDAATARQIIKLEGHSSDVVSAAYSPDSRFIITASEDETARIWNAATGKEIAKLEGHAGMLSGAAYDPDGKFIVTASWDDTARIWNAATAELVAELKGHSDDVMSASYSPDGKFIVTASADKTARIWNAATGEIVTELKGHSDDVYSASYSPDGKFIVTTGVRFQTRIWNAATAQQVAELGGDFAVNQKAAYSPDGKFIALVGFGGSVRIFDTATAQQVAEFKGHAPLDSDSAAKLLDVSANLAWIYCAAYSPDGKFIVTAGIDGTARVWRTAAMQQVAEFQRYQKAVSRSAYSPDGKFIVTASLNDAVRIWDAATAQQIAKLEGHSDFVRTAVYSPDGKFIVTSSDDDTARIWNASTTELVAELEGHSDDVNSASYSPDGKFIVTASDDQTARIWNAATGEMVTELKGHSNGINDANYSPDGKFIVTSSDDDTARIWNASTTELVAELEGHSDDVNSASYSPDGKFIVTASSDKTGRIWNAISGRQIAELEGHSAAVSDAAYSPNGKFIVTTGADNTIRTWNTTTALQITKLIGSLAWALDVTYSPDGEYIIASSSAGVRIYPRLAFMPFDELLQLARRLSPPTLTPEERERYLHEPPSKRPPNAVR